MAKRLETVEQALVIHHRMLEPRLVGLVVATGWLAACAMVGSEPPVAVCLPVVEYSPMFQARAADELALLPADSAIAEMLSDYAAMREQARSCVR